MSANNGFIKIGELSEVSASNIHSADYVLAELNDADVNERFRKFAVNLKKIAPKAEDFLYFSCIMMTSAEASALNTDGTAKLTREGKPVTVGWEVSKNGSWKWQTNDSSIKPYKNNNGDIFPEAELLKAYKKWVEKPLCVDHKSDQVDAVRGIILDTYYDRLNKRVIALCALDKISFPELARGVSSGYKTCVSMGTRVGHAICSDCGQVASNEREFCLHMKNKSAYGEINIDLDPIELSIVVNGADPQAKIRTILAAANQLRSSIESKQYEISKLAISEASMTKFKELEDDIKKISDKLSDLKTSFEQSDENNADNDIYGQTVNSAASSEDLVTEKEALMHQPRFASNNNALRSELQDLKDTVNIKFEDMEKSLASLSHKIKEEIMSVNSKDGTKKEAYLLGGGGVNEPAPGQVKYPVDPLNEQLREHGDKQMVGTDNMGPTDGMFPGDKEKKGLVQRAELEERAMRRAAALKEAKENLMKTKAYWLGGGEGNEPKPGKAQYAVDPGEGKARKEDKQMVGKKPFPAVGDVDGLFPEDLKKKELLQRASLKAKFIRVANEDGSQDLGQSGWEVKRDDEVIFTATVDEISGGNAEGLYDVIATKEFATKMLEKVYKVGAAKAASIYKGAQALNGMGPTPAAPAEMGAPPPSADMGALAPAAMPAAPAPEAGEMPATDVGADGDPKEVALKLAEEMRDRASDLLEAVRELTGEQAEMGELEGLTNQASELKHLVRMKKHLNATLVRDMRKVASDLVDHQEEMQFISNVLDQDGSDTEYASTIVTEAIEDGKKTLVNAYDLMKSVVAYSEGSSQLAKKAQMLADDKEDFMPSSSDEMDLELGSEDPFALEPSDEEIVDDLMGDDVLEVNDEPTEEVEDMNQVMMDVDPNSLQGKKVEIKASLDLSTKEARAAARAKLAAQSVSFSPMLDASNKLADGQPQFDIKPSDSLGKVETVTEVHKEMLDLAEASPKVRKDAARLNDLIVAKKVSVAQLDSLVKEGLDSETVKYWKQFYGQAGKEGSEFATELLKEHAKAQVEEEVSKFKVKIARAYELTNEMVRRGLCTDERTAITAQVDDMMNWNDEGFEAMKRVVNKHQLRKAASFPQIGIIGSGDNSTTPRQESSLQDLLDQAFSNRRY